MASKRGAGLANLVAAELGDKEIGSEHLLLALLHDENGSPASIALRETGLTYRAVLEDLSELPRPWAQAGQPPLPDGGRFLNREAIMVEGRAEGFAGALGSGAVQSEHLLLAILWDDASLASRLIERRGVPRERILHALGRQGLDVRSVKLRPHRRWSEGQAMSAEEFEQRARELRAAGTPYRFRREQGRVFLSVEEVGDNSTERRTG